MAQTKEQDVLGSVAISPAFVLPPHNSQNIYGKMVQVPMAWVGSKMSNIGKWWVTAKSYEITGQSISISIFFLTLVFGYLAATHYERSVMDGLWLNKVHYRMTGLAKLPGEEGVFIPVYKEGR